MTPMSVWRIDMLVRQTGETVWVGELVDDRVHVLHRVFGPDDMLGMLEADSWIPWHACALGHAIVAGLDSAVQDALLANPVQRLTGLTVTDPKELRRLLALARQLGYAVEAHGTTLGEAGIAAPLIDERNQIIGAVGVIGPAERLLADERRTVLADAVRSTAQELTQAR